MGWFLSRLRAIFWSRIVLPAAASFLHDREAVGVEPADRVWIYSADGHGFFGFETRAKRHDAVFNEVEACPLHYIVFVVVGGGDDLFGDAKGGADFGAREFSVLQELEV